MSIQTSITSGLQWLVGKQNTDGSWGISTFFPIANTGLVLIKLESYAREIGYSPFDDNYIYKNNVVKGLDYIFLQALQNANGIYFTENGRISYTTGIVLAAICANAEPSSVINSTNTVINGKTYKEVAQLVVNYLASVQNSNGGWGYNPSDTPDNSVSGYVTLGLDFAEATSFNYLCTIPATLKTKLNSWIDYIQNDTSGGSGYQNPNQYVNILKTGNLIQQMHFYGDDLSSTRLNKAITYIANNWTNGVCTTCDNGGWNGTPADYQSTFTTMKGLSSYGIDTIYKSDATPINWFNEMANVIVNQQNADGSWPFTQWETGNPAPILSTVWALLTLEKVVASPSKIPFKDNVTVIDKDVSYSWDLTETIEIEGETKVFGYKYSNSESDCIPNTKPVKGDDIGFTLVFGNYGEFSYIAPNGKPTVEDSLAVQSPVNLKLMFLSIGNGLRLFNITDNKEVVVCDKFYGGELYQLQVQKLNGQIWEPDFDLPCHSIFSISMLFQIEFSACPHCPEDNPPA